MENNINISNLADELAELTGQFIRPDAIYASTEGRYYYIQAPKTGAPMLLHDYRGMFFVDLHPEDFENISSGNISAHDYIMSANWQVGYYWGGGLMIGGGYYQPIDIISRKDEVRRYLKILSCRGNWRISGYMPTKGICTKCPVNNCPFSNFKQGSWGEEMPESDSRIALFDALCKRFEQENPGYTICRFICRGIPDEEIWLFPNGRYSKEEPRSFVASVSNSMIRALLMREINPENWDEYAKGFQFRVHKFFEAQTYEVTSETLEKAYEGLDHIKKADTQSKDDVNEEKVSLLKRVMFFFKKKF